MKDLRHGDQLWTEWSGFGLDDLEAKTHYFTVDHVDLHEEVVRRGLASALQRDGIADSLSDGFKLLDGVEPSCTWAGVVDEDIDLTVCAPDGETYYGERVDMVMPVTLVCVPI